MCSGYILSGLGYMLINGGVWISFMRVGWKGEGREPRGSHGIFDIQHGRFTAMHSIHLLLRLYNHGFSGVNHICSLMNRTWRASSVGPGLDQP
jgi:hypothetical protein